MKILVHPSNINLENFTYIGKFVINFMKFQQMIIVRKIKMTLWLEQRIKVSFVLNFMLKTNTRDLKVTKC